MKKTVDLKMPEVMLLDKKELKKVDGGVVGAIICGIILTYVVFEAVCNPMAHYEAFMEGREIAKSERN